MNKQITNIIQTIYNMEDPDSPQTPPHLNDKEIVTIKDYSPTSEEQMEEDSPFDQLEHILGQEDNRTSRIELQYMQKIEELEYKCKQITITNSYLTKRVKQLELDLQQYGDMLESDTSSFELLDSVELEVANYKKQFELYRDKQAKSSKSKDQEIKKLKNIIEQIIQQKNKIDDQKTILNEENQELWQTNDSLNTQVQRLLSQISENRSRQNSSRSYRFNERKDSQFDFEVQAELETLIQKLVSQLEFERGQKKKLNDEIRRIQKQMMELQRQITAKNNKIYALQMDSIKSNRILSKNDKSFIPTKSQKQRSKFNKSITPQLNDKYLKKDPSSHLKSISLLQLIRDDELSQNERCTITSKIIDFYMRKFNTKDYASFQLDNLLICNYIKSNPNLSIVRKGPRSPKLSAEDCEQTLILNLGSVVDKLIGQYLYELEDRNETQTQLLNLINDILEQKDITLKYVQVIKELILQNLKEIK